MKYYALNKEEEKILTGFDKGEFDRVDSAKKEIERIRSYTTTSLDRTKNINIRISERDLQKIKARAAEKGIPYQTLVASILHQF